jgi:ribosomal protein L40E
MKVTKKAGSYTIECEGKDAKECFVNMAGALDVFGESNCGACGSTDLREQVRENGGHTFYEKRCMECGATLSYGQRKSDGSMYPRRKDRDGNWMENRGWSLYKPQSQQSREEVVPF